MTMFDKERIITNAKNQRKVLRTAIYIRVSTEEQAKQGFSIPAQKEGLIKFAEDNGYQIVDFYIDEGKSASKKQGRRKEFLRLLQDVEEGKIDHIIFKCIDRWFRSIKEYYNTQSILDKKGVTWECSEEEYDTTTRHGKMKLNLYLMMAEDESDRTSERIKYVFENKIKNKEAILGSHALPFGFKNEVIDGVLRTVVDKEKAHIIYDLFDYFELTQTKKGAMQMINDKYDLSFKYPSICKMLENPFYYGHYRGVDDYIWGGSYLTKERFEKLQKIAKKRNIKKIDNNRVYIFTGLLVCKHCGHKLGGHYQCRNSDYINKDRKYISYRYRCANASNNNACHCKKMLNEKKFEKRLIACIDEEISDYIATYKLEEEKNKPKVNIKELEEELERVNKMYQKKRMTEQKYDKEYERLNEKIKQAKQTTHKKRDLSPLEEFLNSNWKNIYFDLNRAEKRSLWRSVIDYIEVDCYTQEFHITFL